METKQDFSCGGVVIDASRRLLLVEVENLAGSHVWTFPKGHPENGENDTQAALREVHEETGWECQVTGPLADIDYHFVRDGVKYHKVVRWFTMAPLRESGKPMEGEILSCRWVPIADVRPLLTYPTDFKLLEKLL